jgi:hypothetical protein
LFITLFHEAKPNCIQAAISINNRAGVRQSPVSVLEDGEGFAEIFIPSG